MCNVILTEELKQQVDFIAYNIAFSKKSKKFTAEEIYESLTALQLDVSQSKVERIIHSWLDDELIFENLGSYVIFS